MCVAMSGPTCVGTAQIPPLSSQQEGFVFADAVCNAVPAWGLPSDGTPASQGARADDRHTA